MQWRSEQTTPLLSNSIGIVYGKPNTPSLGWHAFGPLKRQLWLNLLCTSALLMHQNAPGCLESEQQTGTCTSESAKRFGGQVIYMDDAVK